MKHGLLLVLTVAFGVALPGLALAETDPPTTTAAASPMLNSHGWVNEDVTVTFHATEPPSPPPQSGVAKIVTKSVINGVESTEETPGADATRVVTAEGSTTIGFGAVDNDGNAEVFQSLVVRIDRTVPTVTIDAPAQGSEIVQGSLIGVSWLCEDVVSGLDNCFGPDESQRSGIVDTSTPGDRSLVITATDKAGNQVTVQRTWKVVEAPTPANPVPTSGGSAPTSFGQIVTLPRTTGCVGTRLVFRLRNTTKVARATFLVNGKRRKTVRGVALRRAIRLSRLPRGRFTVRLVVTMTDGRRFSGSRRYRRC
jgi:hypothetical protein